MAATLVRFYPANLHRKRRDPIRLKAWGFPIPIGDSKTASRSKYKWLTEMVNRMMTWLMINPPTMASGS
jgi:hypothetical protein